METERVASVSALSDGVAILGSAAVLVLLLWSAGEVNGGKETNLSETAVAKFWTSGAAQAGHLVLDQ